MANRTAWTAGNGVGYTWTAAFNSADIASLAVGSSVRSSVADIANQTNQDIFADLSAVITIASIAQTAGAVLSFYLYALLGDGSTYGDGMLPTAGTSVAHTPGVVPCGTMTPPITAVATTTIVGFVQGIIIPPGSFRFAVMNNLTASSTFSATPGTIWFRTYNTQLNN